MDMPECCEVCPCYDWVEDMCRITESPNEFNDARILDCPLREIPTPHGRLIDADMAIKEIAKAFLDKPWWGSMDFGLKVEEIIDNLPTVIEAEERE